MRFRLQRVLDLRCAQERLAQQELAARQQDHRNILSAIHRLQAEEGALFDLLREREGPAIDLPRLWHLYNYSAELDRELSEQETKRQESWRLVERQREAVRQCWQKKRMLEILKARATTAFREMIAGEEQKQIDELVLFSHAEKKQR